MGEPHPSPDAQARPARRAQDRALRARLDSAAGRRLAAHRARESAGDAQRDERQLPALHLLLRRPRAEACDALARAFHQGSDAEAQDWLTRSINASASGSNTVLASAM